MKKMLMEMEEKERKITEVEDMNRRMLMEEICTDLEIRCGGDGKIVKGHRAVLGGRSNVFKAMFQSEEMEEAKTGKLEMEEMSEQGVRALLRWIYWGDEKEALLDSDVAVELLIAGDKWDLGGLTEKMKEIILKRRGYDDEWFSLDSALELYGWARNLEGMEEVKEKAIGVIQM